MLCLKAAAENANHYYLYMVGSDYTDSKGQKKLGLTIHPVHRLHQYNIGDAVDIGLEKRYDALWQTSAQTKAELRAFEAILHAHFASKRCIRKNGQASEWFLVTAEEVLEFMRAQNFIVRLIPQDEIDLIQTKSQREPSPNEKENIEEEIACIEEESLIASQSELEVLKNQFKKTFKLEFRKNQEELFKNTYTMLQNEYGNLKGIVQWPTGAGKTYGMLILIFLLANYQKKNGRIYRGLLISPKNDIFKTIKEKYISKLEGLDIKIWDGSEGKLSKKGPPLTNQHILILACHQGLLSKKVVDILPNISHIHYDEVHRITGIELFELLKEQMPLWNTCALTGTSATPKTTSAEQHRKLAELFGDPYKILHKVDVDEAVREGWIAKPRFLVEIITKTEDPGAVLSSFVDVVVARVLEKGRGGKVIMYIETSIKDTQYCCAYAKKAYPHLDFYLATDGDDRDDDKFILAPITCKPAILFACQRYREGSDIPGLELTGKLLGESTAAHNLIQISGRGLRADYPEKEGWCLLVKACPTGTTLEDVLDSIVLEITDFLGLDKKVLEPQEIVDVVRTYFGDMGISGSKCTQEETLERLQAAYIRNYFAKRTPKEKYGIIRDLNREMRLQSKQEYREKMKTHLRYIENPKEYFSDYWVCWLHFLGFDISVYPPTLQDLISRCKQEGLTTWSDYKQKRSSSLPENPGDLYEDYTNWDTLMGLEEEIVW